MKIYKNIENLEREIWKNIKDYSDYQISNCGRIKSLKFGKIKIRKILMDHKGYHYINLYENGKCKKRKIHILIYETFNNYKLKENECIHHIDNNPINNNINNLKLMTKLDHKKFHIGPFLNKKHSEKSKRKIGISNSKLEEWKVKSIYQISNSPIIKQLKISQREIGEVFGVNDRTVSNIKNGKSWKHIKLEDL